MNRRTLPADVALAAIAIFLAWVVGMALAGEPGLPADTTLPPAEYVVTEGP